jgi:hypothetical protein
MGLSVMEDVVKALVQLAFSGPYLEMLNVSHSKHYEYAQKWGYDFIKRYGRYPGCYSGYCGWDKVFIIRDLLAEGYDYVAWIDSDAIIIRNDQDLIDANPEHALGMRIHRFGLPWEHWHCGVMYANNKFNALDLFNLWISKKPLEETHISDWALDPNCEQTVLNRFAGPHNWHERCGVPRFEEQLDLFKTKRKWDLIPGGGNSPTDEQEAVVLGFHGLGSGEDRLNMMKARV